MDNDSNFLVSLDDVIAYLISYRHKDFYARMASHMNKREVKEQVLPDGAPFMMGVTWENPTYILLYSQEWVSEKIANHQIDELKATIAHEMSHILLRHIPRTLTLYKNLYEEKQKKIFSKCANIAADAVANKALYYEYTHMRKHPDEWITLAKLGFESDMSYEWVIHYILNPDAPLGGSGGKKRDDVASQLGKSLKENADNEEKLREILNEIIEQKGAHHLWEDLINTLTPDEIESQGERAESETTRIVKDTVRDHKKSAGSLPRGIEAHLDDLLKRAQIPWKTVFRHWVTAQRKTVREKSYKRLNKHRLVAGSYPFPGKIRKKTYRILVAYDQSWSMSDKCVAAGLSELQGMQRVDPNIMIDFVAFDTELGDIHTITAHDDLSWLKRERGGGTCYAAFFQLAMQRVKEDLTDLIVIFTDGFASPPPMGLRPKATPLLWCIPPKGVHPCPGYGKDIHTQE
jgi:predicted metal-dependent peptidase